MSAPLRVNIICSEPGVACSGPWKKGATVREVLEHTRQKAVEHDMPVQVEIVGHGTWSITPDGRVVKGALFKWDGKADH